MQASDTSPHSAKPLGLRSLPQVSPFPTEAGWFRVPSGTAEAVQSWVPQSLSTPPLCGLVCQLELLPPQ